MCVGMAWRVTKDKTNPRFALSMQQTVLLHINNVIKPLEEVGVKVIVFTGECVEIHDHIFLYCDVVHHMDKIQQSLNTETERNTIDFKSWTCGIANNWIHVILQINFKNGLLHLLHINESYWNVSAYHHHYGSATHVDTCGWKRSIMGKYVWKQAHGSQTVAATFSSRT